MCKEVVFSLCFCLLVIPVQRIHASKVEELTDKAYESYKKGDFEKSLEFANKALKENSSYGSAWYWQAVALANLGNTGKAVESYAKVIENDSTSGKIQVLDSYHNLLLYYFTKEDYAKAIKYGQEGKDYYNRVSLDIDKTYGQGVEGEIYNYLGWAFYHTENYSKALEVFNNIDFVYKEFREGDITSCRRGLGWTYNQLRKYAKAMENFDKALGMIDERDKFQLRDAYTGRGWSHFFVGEFELAIYDFNSALENTDSGDSINTRDLIISKAFSYLGMMDTLTAFGLVDKAMGIDKSSAYWNTRLRMYFAIGKVEKAWEVRGGEGYLGVSGNAYKKDGLMGCVITEVFEDTPAAKAKILVGDIITRINGEGIQGMNSVGNIVKKISPGSMAVIRIVREGIERDITVEVGSYGSVLQSDEVIGTIKEFNASREVADKQKAVLKTFRPLTEVSFHMGTVTDIDEERFIQVRISGSVSPSRMAIDAMVYSVASGSEGEKPRIISVGDKVLFGLLDNEIFYTVPMEEEIQEGECGEICKKMKNMLDGVYKEVYAVFAGEGKDKKSSSDFAFKSWQIVADRCLKKPTPECRFVRNYLWYLACSG
jgi:tetratricopeptide (TPR) repeat protein